MLVVLGKGDYLDKNIHPDLRILRDCNKKQLIYHNTFTKLAIYMQLSDVCRIFRFVQYCI